MNSQNFFDRGAVQSVDGGLKVIGWTIPSDLFYFEGHFPHLPVLPAVAIIDISLALIQASRPDQPCRLLEVSSAKFQQPLSPGISVNILANFVGDEWTIDWIDGLSAAAQLRLHVGR